MVLKYVTKTGMEFHEPPYTEEEELETYRRMAAGPVAILHSADAAAKRLEARLRLQQAEQRPSSKPDQGE
jgi:hypothetical protein